MWKTVTLLCLAVLVSTCKRNEAPPEQFAAALNEQRQRSLAPRIAGVRHAPFHAKRGETHDASQLRLLSGAATLFRGPAVSPRMEGVAALVIGRTEQSLRALRRAAESGDCAAWSDLAAALLVKAEHEDDPRLIVDAAAAASRAIACGAAPAESRFNLALSMERLGLLAGARRAYGESLTFERNPEWRQETIQRQSAIRVADQAADWMNARKSFVLEPSKEAAAALVASFPQYARVTAEGPDLSEWGEAYLAGDGSRADAALLRARLVGRAIQAGSGDRLLIDVVSTIDEHGASPAQLKALASAHVLYRQGRIARSQHAANAIGLLEEAAAAFHRAGSPMEKLARYYVAGAHYERGEIDIALKHLQTIAADAERRGHLTLAWQTGWERGLCLLVRGSYSAALQMLTQSRAGFARIGERELAASFDSIIAEALDYVGDDREAWRARARCLAQLSRSGNEYRVSITLDAAAQTLIRREEWERAQVVLDAVIAGNPPEPAVLSHVHVERSIVRDELRNASGARQDRYAALNAARGITDPLRRARADAEIAYAEALALKSDNPAGAVITATRALEFFEAQQPAFLPRILLERGRMQMRRGDLSRARSDFARGISRFETSRTSVGDLELRAASAVWGRALYSEAIGIALVTGDTEAAFELSERARARALLDRIEQAPSNQTAAPMSASRIRSMLADHSAIVEFAETPDAVVAFIVRSEVLSVVRLPASESTIGLAVERLLEAEDDAQRARSDQLRQLLYEPLRPHLDGASQLVIVASRLLSKVPFGFLFEQRSGRFLCQEITVIHAPSATIAVLASARAQQPARGRLVTLSGSGFDREAYSVTPLQYATSEALRVAALSAEAVSLVDADATREAFLRELPPAGTIHIASHIVGSGADARLLLAGRDMLSAREIAALPLSHVRLAVLAGCQASTSRASDAVGDIATAFLVAGVPMIVATTTDIDDSLAPNVMERIHRQLGNDGDPASAIRTVASDPSLSDRERLFVAHLAVIGGSPALVRR